MSTIQWSSAFLMHICDMDKILIVLRQFPWNCFYYLLCVPISWVHIDLSSLLYSAFWGQTVLGNTDLEIVAAKLVPGIDCQFLKRDTNLDFASYFLNFCYMLDGYVVSNVRISTTLTELRFNAHRCTFLIYLITRNI